MSTRTLTIGELALRVKSADTVAETIDTAIASDFEVEVEYHYTPGHPGNLSGRWEDAEEPISPTLEVVKVLASANVIFSGNVSDVIIRRDSDLTALFSSYEIGRMEDTIYAAIQAGE